MNPNHISSISLAGGLYGIPFMREDKEAVAKARALFHETVVTRWPDEGPKHSRLASTDIPEQPEASSLGYLASSLKTSGILPTGLLGGSPIDSLSIGGIEERLGSPSYDPVSPHKNPPITAPAPSKDILEPSAPKEDKWIDIWNYRTPTKHCSRCLAFLKKHSPAAPHVSYPNGSMNDVRRRAEFHKCPLCKAVVQVLDQKTTRCGDEMRNTTVNLRLSQPTIKVYAGTRYLGDIRITKKDNLGWLAYNPAYLTLPEGDAFLARKVSPLDLRMVNGWLSDCEGHNKWSKDCDAETYLIKGGRSWMITVIDVEVGCLVEIDAIATPFLALSYVWGQVSMLKTTRDNLQQLRAPGVFNDDEIKATMPKVLLDAMKLTKLVKKRYLWCDALCIVQDDAEHKHIEIAKMGEIYGQAYLTIAALAGTNANEGLLGVSQEGLDLPTHAEIACSDDFADNRCYVPQPPNLHDIAGFLPYETRSWTYQERILSKRSLLFTADYVYFHCQRLFLSRDRYGCQVHLSLDPAANLHWDPLQAMRWSAEKLRAQGVTRWLGMSSAHTFALLVETYSSRSLTYSEDVFDAFDAISQKLSSLFSTAMLNGCPEIDFDYALCWIGTAPLRRRPHALLFEGGARSLERLPTWSWTGWQGGVGFLMDDHCYDHQMSLFTSRVWYFRIEYPYRVQDVWRRDFRGPASHVAKDMPYELTRMTLTLHFSASVVDMDNFVLIGFDLYQHISLVSEVPAGSGPGPSPTFCGAISGDIDLGETKEHGAQLSLVLLSTMATKAYKRRTWNDRFLRHVDTQDQEEWLLNVLLVKRKGSYAERLGFGIISKAAWRRGNSQEQYIRLV